MASLIIRLPSPNLSASSISFCIRFALVTLYSAGNDSPEIARISSKSSLVINLISVFSISSTLYCSTDSLYIIFLTKHKHDKYRYNR